MKVAATAARVVLGLLFVLAGSMPFFMGAPQALPGPAGTFNQVFFDSHWVLFVGAAQLVIGALLLVNRCVPLALIMLAAFLYNSFAFHVTMARGALFAPAIVFALWLLVALRYRAVLLALVSAREPAETMPQPMP